MLILDRGVKCQAVLSKTLIGETINQILLHYITLLLFLITSWFFIGSSITCLKTIHFRYYFFSCSWLCRLQLISENYDLHRMSGRCTRKPKNYGLLTRGITNNDSIIYSTASSAAMVWWYDKNICNASSYHNMDIDHHTIHINVSYLHTKILGKI